MKKIAVIVFSIAFLAVSCKQSDPEEKVYQLIWSDEFEGGELDLNKWEVQTGNGFQYGLFNWGNNELQWYLEDNVTVEDGKLVIRSEAETIGNYDYTSARIRSLGRGDFRYGRMEASIKMSYSAGLWHAFWMLPSEATEPWPISGEIDIMEFVGNVPNEIFNTIHFVDGAGNQQQLGDLEPYVQQSEFHTYAVEWDRNSIVWFFDDVETYQVSRTNDLLVDSWPFDEKFHLLLNTAVGGNLGGNVDAVALQEPKFMEVEFVRVYQQVTSE